MRRGDRMGCTHLVLALGVHEAGFEHVQGLAQECGTSTLGRGSGSAAHGASSGQSTRETQSFMPSPAQQLRQPLLPANPTPVLPPLIKPCSQR